MRQVEQKHPAFKPAPELDFIASVQTDVPGWSENMFFQLWDPLQGVGIYTHIGRVREDPTLWRSCLAVYLPEGKVLAQRTHGRAADNRGPHAGSMQVLCVNPGTTWKIAYDGVAELTDSLAMARRIVGGGVARPLKLDLMFEARSPTYDLFAARNLGHTEFAHLHHEQAFDVTGTISFDGVSYPISGFGFRDHSLGARDLSGFGGNTMFYASFPSGRVVQALQNFAPDGSVRMRSGFVVEDGVGELLELIEAPRLESTDGAPDEFSISYTRAGQSITVTGKAVHRATFSINMPNDWSVGTDLLSNDPLIIVEQPCEVRWPGGEVGFGNLERNFRRSSLRCPSTTY